tara:strand:+ start:90 stop:650 length:561 start_codon:yes stop_codon:yes gene_type:complete
MLDNITHNYYSLIDPPNKEEILMNIENSELTEDQEFPWANGCAIQLERLDLQEKFIPLFRSSLEIFFNELNLDLSRLSLYCHEIWRNTYSRNFFQEIHDHTPLHLSGVLFLTDEKEDDGRFFFYNEGYKEVSREWRDLGFYGDRKFIRAERGKILLFPSHMLHGVSVHKSDNIRKTVSFNIIFNTD